MFIIHPGADLCQRPGPFHKPKAAGNPAAFLHRETLLRREFLNPCRLRHTSPIPFSLWPAATTGLRRTPAGGISASLKCGRNLRFPHKRPLPGTCSLFSFHFARQGHINQGIPLSFCGSPENRPPQARQRTAPRRGQAEPGRNSAHMDFLNASALCTRSGSDNKNGGKLRRFFVFWRNQAGRRLRVSSRTVPAISAAMASFSL